jgi:ATP-binding cassette subfamily B protein
MRGGFYSKFSREHEGSYQAALLNRKNVSFYLALLASHRKLLAAALVMTFLQTAASLTPPLIMQRVIDEHLLPGTLSGLLPLMIVFFALYGASWYFSYQQRLLSQTAGQRAIFDVRELLFAKLMALPLSYHEHQQKGALISLMMNDVNALSAAVTDGVIGLISDVVTLGAMICIMYRLHPGLTLLLMATLPVVLLAMSLLGRRIRNAFREVREKMAALNTQVEENFSGIRVVQSMGVQQQQEQDFFQVSEDNLQAGLKAMILLALIFPLTSLTTGTGTALLLWYGGQQVMQQTITLGVFAAFLTYLRKFYQPLRNLSDLYNTYLSALASLDRIMTVLDEPNPLALSQPLPAIPEPIQGEIEFDHVSFSYGESKEPSMRVLKDLSLHLKPGEHVGIAGATGAGKTTLFSLLVRMMDPQEGEIRLDGTPLFRIPHDQLHRLVSVVPQQVFLFSGTIRENIRFGKPDADDQEVIAAAKNAMAHEMIMGLSKGYETVLGEEGAGLSGGQRQLIAFARALLKNAPILVLDEATASMDVDLESQVQASLEQLLKERTALIIAHRLSTLRKLDRICVLAEGRITACGSHDELIKTSPYYRQLLESGSAATRPASGG